MKPALALFIIIFFYSCVQKNKEQKSTSADISQESIDKPDTLPTNPIAVKQEEKPRRVFADGEWERYEDSLRLEILKRKENKMLKESFLQEMYIRDVARVSNDSVLVMIPFNVHGQDCGARDGYSTDISFGFKAGDKLVFSQTLPFREHEHEHGNVEKEINFSDHFQLVEQTAKHVIYHSAKYKRTLVLFSAQQNGTSAFYFTGVGKSRINGKNVYHLVDEYNRIMDKQKGEVENAIYPFTSRELSTNEYENFLD